MAGRTAKVHSGTVHFDTAPYRKAMVDFKMMAEYNLLKYKCPPNMYVVPTSSPLIWEGAMFLHHGLYKDGIFKFTVHIPSSHPSGECPKVFLPKDVFHPQVDMGTGEVNISSHFNSEMRRQHDVHIYHLLEFVRNMFFNITVDNAVNPTAAELFRSDKRGFEEKVKWCVAVCGRVATSKDIKDGHSIKLLEDKWNAKVMNAAKRHIFDEKIHQTTPKGLSWVEEGTYTPFTKYK